MPREKVFVWFYNQQNIGDDLFLDTLLARFPDKQFFIHGDANLTACNPDLLRHGNLSAAPMPLSVKSSYQLMQVYDRAVLIGGSIFQDFGRATLRQHVARYGVFWRLRQQGKKIAVIGANLGPFHTRYGQWLIKQGLRFATSICVRDKYSQQQLHTWGMPHAQLAPDAVFAHPYQPAVVQSANAPLGISVINTALFPDKRAAYLQFLATLATTYLQQDPSHKVQLFGFAAGVEDDAAAIRAVLALMPDTERVQVVQYGKDMPIVAFLDQFAACRAMVASRFHAIILALKYQIPFMPILYSEKCRHYLMDMGYQAPTVDYTQVASATAQTILAALLAQPAFPLPDTLEQQAMVQFAGLNN